MVDIGYKSEGIIPAHEFDDIDSIEVGDEVEVLLERLENDEGMVILSKEKAAYRQNWNKIASVFAGDGLIKGKVKSVVKGGLMVNIGVEAFLPASQIDIIPPKDLQQFVGNTYDFKIVKINDDRKNVVLSRRELIEQERSEKRQKFLEGVKVGDMVKGTVKNLTDFGAFIDLDGISGRKDTTQVVDGLHSRLHQVFIALDLDQETATLTDLGRYAIRRTRGMAQPGEPVLQVRITLAEVTDPAVWRRVLVPAGYTLDRVHAVIQAAMGWQNSHLHQFMIDDREYGAPDPDEGHQVSDERRFRLGNVVKAGDRIEYTYDFGDGWEHEVAIEAAAEAETDGVYPACTGGEGACPPEDSGGAPGFAELKALLAGPSSPERDEIREWAGDYDPARFDLTAANAAVAAI